MVRALLLGALFIASAARAADPQPELVNKQKEQKAAVAASSGQVTPAPPPRVPEQALGAVSATGVDDKPRRGVFAEATLGFFTTLGGSRFFSNGQPYLGLMVGTELGDAASIFASLGVGASSASCFDLDSRGNCRAADSFGATYLEAGASYGLQIGERTLLSGKIVAGITNFSPGPVLDTSARSVPDNLFGPHAGFGLALDYDTRLDHFAVGIDALARYTIASRPDGTGSLGIASIAIMPRLRYVF